MSQEQDKLQISIDVSAEHILLQPSVTTPSAYSTSNVLPQNIQDITLIWCDPSIDKNEDKTKEMLKINHPIIPYTDELTCIDYIKSIKLKKVFLITCARYSSNILNAVDKLRQVDSVYIFDLDTTENYQHLQTTSMKLMGRFDKHQDLIDALKENILLVEEQLEKFTFYDQHRQKSTRDLSKESAEYLWFQMFKDVILQMPSDKKAKQELIKFCQSYYHGETRNLTWIEEFNKNYGPEKAIEWYTQDSFLYKIVNKALRTEDIEQLYIFRFFIVDLSSYLTDLFKKTKQNLKSISRLYRGLNVDKEQFLLLEQSKNKMISTNGFFSTSSCRNVALMFTGKNSSDRCGVLFEIQCDINKMNDMTIFVDIHEHSNIPDENEYLFDIGATFMVLSIDENTELNVWIIRLQTTDKGGQLAREYIELNRKETYEETSVNIMFGKLLTNMGKYDQALKYFQKLLVDPKQNEDIARIYNEIGKVYDFKTDFDKAIKNYDKSYELWLHSTPSQVKQTARPLSNKAIILWRKGDKDGALELYHKALKITKEYYGKEHELTAAALVNIGIVYEDKEQYKQSLTYHCKALKIHQKCLPNDHIYIASTLINIGSVYMKQHKFTLALKNFKKSLKMNQKLLSPEHLYVAASLIAIASVFEEQGRLGEALNYLLKARDIQEKHFGEFNDSNLDGALTLRRIGEIYQKQQNYTIALDYYQKALEMVSKMPADHPERMKLNERITCINDNTMSNTPSYTRKRLHFCCSK